MAWTASSWSTARAVEATKRLLPSSAGSLQGIISQIQSLRSPLRTSSSILQTEKVLILLFSQLFEQSSRS